MSSARHFQLKFDCNCNKSADLSPRVSQLTKPCFPLKQSFILREKPFSMVLDTSNTTIFLLR